jgi:hypothetical protein
MADDDGKYRKAKSKAGCQPKGGVEKFLIIPEIEMPGRDPHDKEAR